MNGLARDGCAAVYAVVGQMVDGLWQGGYGGGDGGDGDGGQR